MADGGAAYLGGRAGPRGDTRPEERELADVAGARHVGAGGALAGQVCGQVHGHRAQALLGAPRGRVPPRTERHLPSVDQELALGARGQTALKQEQRRGRMCAVRAPFRGGLGRAGRWGSPLQQGPAQDQRAQQQ